MRTTPVLVGLAGIAFAAAAAHAQGLTKLGPKPLR